jgi:PAS domain S-box-containing protein
MILGTEGDARTRAELLAELEAMDRLHQLSARLLSSTALQPLLEEVVDATIALLNADCGNVQLYDPAVGALKIVAQRGFRQDFLDYFDAVHEGTGACGAALQQGARIIVEDVLTDPIMAPHTGAMASAGIRAVQSTPLASRDGEPLGMISTHFREPHRPTDHELRFLDLYATQAADLIERKQSEDALRAAVAQTEMILDSIGDNFFAFGRDWRFTYLNKQSAEQMRMLGKDPKRLIGQVLWDVFPTVPNEAAVRRVMTERVPVRDELFYPPLDEWVENDMYPSPDGGIVSFQRYITNRKRTEAALRASEERFRRYFDLGLIGMAITTPGKGITEVNDELCRLLGYEREELLHMTWAELTHPDDLAADIAEFNRVVAGLIDGYSIDKRWIRKDGGIVQGIMAAQCVRRSDGTVDYFVGLVQDITERRLAEQRLAESERRFRLLADFIPHHVWSFHANAAGRIDDTSVGYRNQRLIDYTGLTDDEFRQGGWAALHPDDVERVRAAWAVALEHGTHYEMEHRLRGRDGRYRRFVVRAVPVEHEGGRAVEWFGTDTDVEDYRRAEEALQNLQVEHAHVARVATLGELAASIAHEVNQPLAAIVTNGHACRRWLAADPTDLREANASLDRIVRDANRAADVIRRIRAFLKQRPASPTRTRLDEAVSEVLAMVRTEMHTRGVSARVALAADLPAVAADRIQVQQVVLNLVINAIEAMSAVDDRERTVEIETGRQGADTVYLAVRDRGVGVPPGQQDRIFDAFHTTKPHGLGMGLAISRSIVEGYGGRLWSTSNEGPGATFQFTLPVWVPPTPPADR